MANTATSRQRVRTTRLFRRPDDGFHVHKVFIERAAAGRREAIGGLRHAEVAVGGSQEMLQFVERQLIVGGQGADDAEAQAPVNQSIEREGRYTLHHKVYDALE